jgi:hypothetical protein
MTSASHDAHRLILLSAARGLVKDAMSSRASMPENAPERQFFLGVEAAAQEVIHPELAASRVPDWLDHQPPLFRDGYTRTSFMIRQAKAAADAPMHLALPEPPATPAPR